MSAIAVALKSNQVHIILIDPYEKTHKLFKTFQTEDKATSMVEINANLIAVAIGNRG